MSSRISAARVLPLVTLVSLLSPAWLVACGGATQSDLFGGGAGAGPQDGGSSAIDSGNGDNVDASPAVDASTGIDAGHPRDSGVTPVDAGGPPDTGVVVDSGAGDPGIYCGKDLQNDVYCPVGQDDCCITGQGTSALIFKCEAVGAVTCTGVAATCDDTADCTGNKVCCGAFDGQRYRDVSCRSSCSGQGPNGTTLRRFCDPNLPSPGDCPQGTACQASQVLTGYFLCL